MRIYIDSDYRCHLVDDGTMRPVDTDFFDGKCQTFIEGYRFVPAGESWTREDGCVFRGEMIFPAVNSADLEIAQRKADEEAHLAELGALIEEIYNEDLEVIDDV